MKFLLLSLALIVTASAFKYTTEWEMWKREHGKVYKTEIEELARQTIFETNNDHIINHNSNSDKWGYTLGLNEYADLDPAEFAKVFNGYIERPSTYKSTNLHVSTGTCAASAPTKDWRTVTGRVTAVKNQGQCGSCWAFSTTGSMEGQESQHNNSQGLIPLSEQQLADCSTAEGNHGCQGGLMDNAFKYVIKNNGLESESDYPYKGANGKCSADASKNVAQSTISSFTDIPESDCASLQDACCNKGPISVAMDASHMSFQLYKSGIYNPFLCSSTKLDHGVLLVGYGTESGKNYFLVKNSWGTTWGMDGYFKIVDRRDKCGICTSASYPVV